MDTYFPSVVSDTLQALWPLKYWIAAIALALSVVWFYHPAEDYIPAPSREDDRP